MNSLDHLNRELARAAKIRDLAERSITIASIIAEALRSVDQDPVLVGGAAVEFYTNGGYATADIDMLAFGGPDLSRVMKNLGFKRYGKDYVNETLKIYVEFPGQALEPSEMDEIILIDGRQLRIISIEDLIVDRLAAFKFSQSSIDGLNVMKLMEIGDMEEDRLQARAQEEDVMDALEKIHGIREEIIRKKCSPKEANLLLTKTMKGLK